LNQNKNRKKTLSQEKLILLHLISGAAIDIRIANTYAFRYCTRLAARIKDIKDKYHHLNVKSSYIVTRGGSRIKQYWLSIEDKEAVFSMSKSIIESRS